MTTQQRSIVSGAPSNNDHFLALDGLRGLSVTLVFFFHASKCFNNGAWSHYPLVFFIVDRGYFGVDIFFVLSGFLITGILVKARTATNYYSVFYQRRALRIFPVYYLAVLLVFLLDRPGGQPFSWHVQIWYWLNLSNWYSAFFFHPIYLTQFWTLAIEEQFYLFWPVLVRNVPGKWLGALCLAMLPLQYGLRLLPAVQRWNDRYPEFIHRAVFLHTEGLFLGALLALLWPHLPDGPFTRAGLRCAVVLAGVATLFATLPEFVKMRAVSAAQTSLWSVFGALVIALLLRSGTGLLARSLSAAPLRRLGRYSYCIYVNHIAVILLSGQFLSIYRLPHPRVAFPFAITAVFLLSVAVAALSWRVLEEPVLSLKRFTRYRFARENT